MDATRYADLRRERARRQERFDVLSSWIEGHALSRANDVPDQPDLDAALLERTHRELDGAARNLERRAEGLSRELAENLTDGDVSHLESRQGEFRELRAQHQDLVRRRKSAYRAWQERVIEDGMIEGLGSRARYLGFEKLVVALTVVVLLVLAREMAGRPGPTELWVLFAIDTACCSVFWFEFLLRLRSASDRQWFWRKNWIDLASAIPVPPEALIIRLAPVLPLQLLHAGRALRLFRILRVLRVVRVAALMWGGMERLGRVADMRLMTKSLRWLVVIWVLGGTVLMLEAQPPGGVLEAEPAASAAMAPESPPAAPAASVPDGTIVGQARRNPDFRIDRWGDRFWWSATTVVTGGYADIHDPRLGITRLLTALLVLSGVIVVGVFTATLTSVYVGEEAQQVRRGQAELSQSLQRIQALLES